MGELRHLTERERRRRLLDAAVEAERHESGSAERLPPIEEPEKRVSSE